ncbi:MAG TPA: xanthine dehydrogenase family protein molybdopterin-binding subunit [Stellaceae bacterium]
MDVTRRGLLRWCAAAGGVLAVGIELPLPAARAQEAEPVDLTAWVLIGPDDRITIRVAQAEMGQGVHTSMAMLVAEELEVDWRSVRVETAPVGPEYENDLLGAQMTGSSSSVRAGFRPLRQAGAAAREMLRQAGARSFGVPVEECAARNGRIVHVGSGRGLAYGELAAAAAALAPPEKIALKEPAAWTIIGKPVPRLDTPAKVDGTAIFGIDVRVPGMLTGAIRQSPAFGGKLSAVDDAPALQVRGVRRVVTLERAVVVLADDYWAAAKGLDALQPAWTPEEPPSLAGRGSDAIDAALREALDAPAPVVDEAGDVDAVFRGAAEAAADGARRIDAAFEVPFLAHAAMEPLNATARVTAQGAEVWAGTQAPGPTRKAVAELLGIPAANVAVHNAYLGGGFGRRLETDFVLFAVQAARAAGRPVKLIWSREEDMRHDFYRPASKVRLSAVLAEDGTPRALLARVASPSILTRTAPALMTGEIDSTSIEGLVFIPYAIGSTRVEYARREVGVPVGFWRSVGHSQNCFFLESFIDELADEAGRDPVDFRRPLLASDKRVRNVLETAAAGAGWSGPVAASGRHRGIAMHRSFGSIAACVAEISVNADHAVKLHRFTCALDCGIAVNPDTIRAQVEGSVAFALSAAFFGEIGVSDGGVVRQSNFDDYPVLRLHQMPQVDVRIVESGARIGGVGEPATPPVAPAVANAIHAATGKRLRALPFARSGFTLL